MAIRYDVVSATFRAIEKVGQVEALTEDAGDIVHAVVGHHHEECFFRHRTGLNVGPDTAG